MAVRGRPVDLLSAVAGEARGLESVEQVGAARSMLRNGRYTDAGSWRRRMGATLKSTIPTLAAVEASIPHPGLLVCGDGTVWRIGKIDEAPALVPGRIEGARRATWAMYDGKPVIAAGGPPMTLDREGLRRLGFGTISRPSAPTATIPDFPGLVPPGDVIYGVSWITREGESRLSVEVTVTVPYVDREQGATVQIVRPALPTGYQKERVLGWRLYRRSSTSEMPRLVQEFAAAVPRYDDSRPWDELLPEIRHEGQDSTALPAPSLEGITNCGDHLVGFQGTNFIWNNPGELDGWDSSNFSSVAPASGRIRAALALDRELYLFCESAVELWVNTGGAITFQRRRSFPIGTLSGDSCIMLGGIEPAWIGADRRIYKLTSGSPQDITGFQAEHLREINARSLKAWECRREGVVYWSAVNVDEAIVYDYKRNAMMSDASWDGADWRTPLIASRMEWKDTSLGFSATDGSVYELSWDAANDDGLHIRTVNRFTVALSATSGRGRINELELRMKRGHVESDPRVIVRWGFDQGPLRSTWSVPLAGLGLTAPVVRRKKLGYGFEATFEIESVGLAECLLTAAILVVQALNVDARLRGSSA
jgi:hypothetical protein